MTGSDSRVCCCSSCRGSRQPKQHEKHRLKTRSKRGHTSPDRDKRNLPEQECVLNKRDHNIANVLHEWRDGKEGASLGGRAAKYRVEVDRSPCVPASSNRSTKPGSETTVTLKGRIRSAEETYRRGGEGEFCAGLRYRHQSFQNDEKLAGTSLPE